MAPLRLSPARARRIALGAQGFADPRPNGRIDRRHLRRVFERIGVIQIDSVNVVVRSQELPLFSRLGPHPRTMISDASHAGELFEYWVHEASHVPTADYHLYRWSMRIPHRWAAFRRLAEQRPDFIEHVYRHIADNGPVVSGELKQRVGPKGTWWDWDDGKIALEALFHTGRLTARRRVNDFARVYDLAERTLPAEVLARPALPEVDARKELLVRAAKHHGVGTFEDLTDYHRQRNPPCRPLITELVEEGRLIEAAVVGWNRPAYVHPDAIAPRRITARALLSPFDSLVWNRDRIERLFGFRYRIEIYVPPAKRQYGYYVLPFLLGDELVARVDLKSDRQQSKLLVQSAWGEPGIHEPEVASELLAELRSMAAWLGLETVELVGRGDLSPALRRAAAATAPSAASG
ncbi:MAG: winged helix-turn-helix domain-containing protein [Ilumatobacteraceae bacterium]